MNCIEKMENHQCRTCYNATKGLKHLTNLTKCEGKQKQKSYAELLKEISNINIMEDTYKELPQFICDVCSSKLKMAYAFVKQAEEINERLMAIIGKVDTNKQLDCLQEPEVDIKSFLDIKMDYADIEAREESDAHYNTELENEAPDEIIQNRNSNVLLSTNKSVQANCSTSIVDITAVANDDEDNVSVSASKLDSESLNSEDDYPDNMSDDFEWPDEKQNSQSKKNVNENENSKKTEELIKDADDDLAVPCSQCGKIFDNSKALTLHLRFNHVPEDRKFACPLCSRKYSRSSSMRNHMRTVHGSDIPLLKRIPSTEERIFQCDKCPRSYAQKIHLKVHIKNKHSKLN